MDSQGALSLVAWYVCCRMTHFHLAIWWLLASQYALDLVATWTSGCITQPLVDAVCAECVSTGQRLGVSHCSMADSAFAGSLFCSCTLWPSFGIAVHHGFVHSHFLTHAVWNGLDDLPVLMNDVNRSHKPLGPTDIILDSCVHPSGEVSHSLVGFFGSCKVQLLLVSDSAFYIYFNCRCVTYI